MLVHGPLESALGRRREVLEPRSVQGHRGTAKGTPERRSHTHNVHRAAVQEDVSWIRFKPIEITRMDPDRYDHASPWQSPMLEDLRKGWAVTHQLRFIHQCGGGKTCSKLTHRLG
eukprot:3941149-Rhodomonas_salina.1